MARTKNTMTRLLPRLFTACLLLCAGSGALLLCQYRPFGDVFIEVEAMTAAPFGFFFRGLHRVSGQCCAVLALLHAAEHVLRGADLRFSPRTWARLVGSVTLTLWLLLTGYILAGDLRGVQAGTVLRSLIQSVPLAGERLAPLAVGQGDGLFLPPYIQHCFLAPLALVLLLARHARRLLPHPGVLTATLAALGVYALLVPLPTSLAPHTLTPPILAQGDAPWFFLGLQELLRRAPAELGTSLAVVLPVLFFGALAALPAVRGRARTLTRSALGAAMIAYMALSLAALVS